MAAVTLDELKRHLRIDTNDEDEYLTDLMAHATAACADFCLLDALPDPAPLPAKRAVLLYAGYLHADREGWDADKADAMLAVAHSLLWPYRDLTKLV